MALEYSTLKTRVIDYSGRDDLSDKFDTFLLLAESAMYNVCTACALCNGHSH